MIIVGENYESFKRFVTKRIPKVRDEPKVWNAFLWHSGVGKRTEGASTLWGLARNIAVLGDPMTETVAALALTTGMPPRIVTASVGDDKLHGWVSADTPGYLYLNETWVQRFEADSGDSKAKKFMLALILHELIHWVDLAIDGRFQEDGHPLYGKVTNGECGWQFEKKAFGGPVPAWKDFSKSDAE